MSFNFKGKNLILALTAIGVVLMSLILIFSMSKLRSDGDHDLARTDSTMLKVPAVQMLIPGFSVQEIPVDLPNINVVRYGSDGRLYALAYDGHIFVPTDTDGDGIEDTATPWWDKKLFMSPVGMALAEEGIYVTST